MSTNYTPGIVDLFDPPRGVSRAEIIEAVWDHSAADGSTRLVHLAIASFCDGNGECSVGFDMLEAVSGVNLPQLVDCIINLKKAGMIEVTADGMVNHYRLTLPEL